jgi:NAD(P)-dependent dehydrogenase (short-subunit alcohol dehydrogenase family)
VLFSGQRTLVHHAKSTSDGASKGVWTTSVYSATKSAVRSFARTWTVYLKHRNILINLYWFNRQTSLDFAHTEEEIMQIKANLIAAVSMVRMESHDENTKAVSFLASYHSYRTMA